MLAAAVAAFLVSVAPAAAYVTPLVDRSGVHSLLTCFYPGSNPPPGVLGGTGDSKGSISSSTDLWPTVGCGAPSRNRR